jgi:hypothetical protein
MRRAAKHVIHKGQAITRWWAAHFALLCCFCGLMMFWIWFEPSIKGRAIAQWVSCFSFLVVKLTRVHSVPHFQGHNLFEVLLVLERNGQFSYGTNSLAKSSCVSHHQKVMHKGRDTTELASCFVQVVIFLHDSWSKQTLNIGGAS